jgi:hypothetical protein
MRHFLSSLIITALGLSAAYYWGGATALLTATFLGIMEVSLSFDNAVVNATVLRDMSPRWQRRFLTWGMLIAVFGVRFLLPVLIVAWVTGHELVSVVVIALKQPDEYARHLSEAHAEITLFGAMYLLLVFLAFFFEENKSLHWVAWLERRLASMGKLESIEVVLALLALLGIQHYLPEPERLPAMIAGLAGVILFVVIKSVSTLFEQVGPAGDQVHKAGFISFLYLELLDLSFSFDGVIGAFAITKDVVVILLGLTIGAMFVRSLTLLLVQRNMLEEYLFLEHGAHYAIGALALLMLADTFTHVPEWATGLIGMSLILMSLWSSIRLRRRAVR